VLVGAPAANEILGDVATVGRVQVAHGKSRGYPRSLGECRSHQDQGYPIEQEACDRRYPRGGGARAGAVLGRVGPSSSLADGDSV
jgi:hypothetical protein